MTLSLMVSTADQSIMWVSNSFAEHFGVSSSELLGRPVLELLEGSSGELWAHLFTGIEAVDERFDEMRVRRAGEPTSVDDFELRGARYVDGGRKVMVSLRPATSTVGSDESVMLAELELRHSELLSGSRDGVVVHDGSSVLFANDVAAGLIGVASADAVGMAIASLIHPKRPVDTEIGIDNGEGAPTRWTRMLLQRTSGTLVEVEVSMALVSWKGRKAVQIVLHDLSLKRHSQRSDAVLQVVENAVSDAVVSTDENLHIVDWNRSARELYGWSLDEVVGMSIGDVLGPAADSMGIGDDSTIDSSARSDAWMGIVSHRHRDGHEVFVESSQIILRDSDGSVGGLLEVNRQVDVIAEDESTTEAVQHSAQHDDASFVAEVRAALASGEISVAYQPIVELGTGRLHKVEALARWTHSRRGAIHPSEFIPLAERSGIIDELGVWILERACADVLLMDGEGIDVELSVNISVVQLRDPAVSQRIARLLTDTGFPPNRLWIEVTESVLLDNKAILPLQVLHDMGVRLVVDDFGTGYATFQYITRLPVDALKIDATFVSGLGIDVRDTAIVRSVVNLSRELGIEVVAEGVETEFQRSQLLALQCRFGQGWLFGRPVQFAELVTQCHSSASVEGGPTTRPAVDVEDLVDRSPSAAVTSAQATPASPPARPLTPTARLTAVDPEAATARLAASRSLLRVDTIEAAVGVCIALVRELGGRMIPARLDDGRAIPIDCSFGHGEPLLPFADAPLSRLRLERVLPEVLEDARLVISRIRQNDDLHEQARTDPLTGLMNRRAVDQVLNRLRSGDALIAIDLDHFKSVNDTWGHAAGDDVLIAYSRALRGCGRGPDHFARLGGEELLAVVADASEDELSAFLGRLQETWLAVRPYEVTYSAGCAWGGNRSGTETLSVADAALYRAKQAGRDRAIIEPRRSREGAT